MLKSTALWLKPLGSLRDPSAKHLSSLGSLKDPSAKHLSSLGSLRDPSAQTAKVYKRNGIIVDSVPDVLFIPKAHPSPPIIYVTTWEVRSRM